MSARYTLIVESDWIVAKPSREKLWSGYKGYPDWLKEKIEEDIERCKKGDHIWTWSKDSRETLHGKHEATCTTKGCCAISTFK